jgi:hypothetical protein
MSLKGRPSRESLLGLVWLTDRKCFKSAIFGDSDNLWEVLWYPNSGVGGGETASLYLSCVVSYLIRCSAQADASPHLKNEIPQSMVNGHERDYGGSDSKSVPISPIALVEKLSLQKTHPTIHSPSKPPIGVGNNSPSENNFSLIHSSYRPTRLLYHVLFRLNLSLLLDTGLEWVYHLVYRL